MKRYWLKALTVGTVTAILLSFCHFEAVCGEIRHEVLRLHVLAHSDEPEEQALKLKVRDAVLAAADGLLDGVENTVAARATVEGVLPQLQQAAADCLAKHGSDHAVEVALCEMYFTTRTYDAGTLPAGWYHALRVTIGEGKGQNWWCVVFPPLCLSSATCATELSDVLDQEACAVVEKAPRYKVRLKVVEWMSAWF